MLQFTFIIDVYKLVFLIFPLMHLVLRLYSYIHQLELKMCLMTLIICPLNLGFHFFLIFLLCFHFSFSFFPREAHWITWLQKPVYRIKQMRKVWKSSKAERQISGLWVASSIRWFTGTLRLLSLDFTPKFKLLQIRITKFIILMYRIPGYWISWKGA